MPEGQKFLLILSNGETYELDNELGLKRKSNDNQILEAAFFKKINVESNNSLYILINRELNKVAIVTPDFKNIKEVGTDKTSIFLNASFKKNGKSNQIFIHDAQKGYNISFSRNKYFLLSFLV